MNYQHRPTKPQDFPACLALMYDGFQYDTPMRGQLAEVWHEVLSEGRGVSAVVEAVPSDGQPKIVGFGLHVFVSEIFSLEVRTGGLPFYPICLLERHLAGQSPILSREAIRARNAGPGLTAAALGVGHIGPEGVDQDEFHGVMAAMLTASQEAHRGYHMREVLVETCGEQMCDQLIAGGLRLRSDYTEFYARDPQPPSSARWPYLLGLTRAEAVAQPFDTFSFWFHYNRPCFRFTAAHQELLRHALTNQTDDDLARSLNVSRWTVKKRWQAIYSIVEAILPNLLPPEGVDTGGRLPTRGTERRRHLMHYLREHMEELRP